MNSENFCFWLKGFFDLSPLIKKNLRVLTHEQVTLIISKLDEVCGEEHIKNLPSDLTKESQIDEYFKSISKES